MSIRIKYVGKQCNIPLQRCVLQVIALYQTKKIVHQRVRIKNKAHAKFNNILDIYMTLYNIL